MIPAFPGASGWGALATGGRGGEIREVTNLNNSGAGSFREAVSVDGPAIVVFRVGGVCTLEGNLPIKGTDLTIAGQTAPGGGFTFDGGASGYDLNIEDANIIIRYLSLRSARFGLYPTDAGVHTIMIDHCSMSWGNDDMVDIWYSHVAETRPDLQKITIQNCLLAEPLDSHPTGINVGGGSVSADLNDHTYKISIHNNLFVSVGWRTPRVACQNVEVVNNVVYNWDDRACEVGPGTGDTPELGPQSDWVRNYFLRGPMSPISSSVGRVFWHNPPGSVSPLSSLYLEGNIAPDATDSFSDPDADNWPLIRDNDGGYPNSSTDHQRVSRLTLPTYPVPERPATEMKKYVPGGAGNIHRLEAGGDYSVRRDSLDEGWLGNWNDVDGVSSSPVSAGSLATIAAGTAYTDTDGDGMPDEWEIAQGLDPNDPSDGPLIGPDGYSNLERFLNGIQGGTGMEAIDNGDGTYTLTLTSGTEIGKATITGEVNGVPIVDIAEVDFTVGVADPATSEILAAPSSIPADGSSTSQITVQLKDANGNPLTQGGDTVVLLTDLGFLG